jgi:hypothetical protein
MLHTVVSESRKQCSAGVLGCPRVEGPTKRWALCQTCTTPWISYPRLDEFDELSDFVLGKLRYIKVASPLSGENLHRQAGELVRGSVCFQQHSP